MTISRRDFVNQTALAGLIVGASPGGAPATTGPTPTAEQAELQSANKPDQVIRQMMVGFQLTQMVYVAVKLNVADQLAAGPNSIGVLAKATGAHEDSLYRLMRTLAGYGVFAEDNERRFRLTPAAELLRSGVSGSLRNAIEARGEDWTWRAWGALLESVKTGKTGFDVVYGKNTFDWFAEHPDAARIFDRMQADLTARTSGAVVAAYDFSNARVVVDVGGGSGTLLSAILGRYPAARGVLFDLPHVVKAAAPALSAKWGTRCELVGGDFFKTVPEGGDVYIVKHILHDWDDARAQAIVATCHRAMKPGAALLVVEDLVCGPNVRCDAKLGDLNMLARAGGRNRTEREYRDLLGAGPFATRRVLPVTGDLTILEAMRS
jgi:SAM-dependent methyltransferase